ncbi:MBL fold metallo-hydrolase [Parachlamydia sp. AcF125]|uniref:MBL fold metallo-hydrolase n=1 Tax=Parachlamydia sp. AcF125 TaxID=2795736 RepID=UPI001BC9B16E|nr:MBL fold metallo-hydrolase [Parachlamydia sp. AcF125]MBS4167949.1 Hydroxyacylglutathione hydrolase GloC [Parachlamydia sp. AcF125]
MKIKKSENPNLSIHTYLIIDEETQQAAVVDPARNIEPLLALIEEEKVQVTYILETHVHADFVSGAKELKHHLQKKPVIVCSGLGGEEWQPRYADRLIAKDREILNLGHLALQAWYVPGHTPEHIMWLILKQDSPLAVFSGDFLLGGSLGRPDLLGQSKLFELAKLLYQSAFHVLRDLPDHLPVYPAHGAGSFCGKNIADKSLLILGEEKRTNPHLIPQAEEMWIKQLLEGMPPAPSYFSRLKQLNVKGADLIQSLVPPRRLEAQELHSPGLVVVDLRDQEAFAQSFVKGSINIPFGLSFTKWAAEILLADSPLALVTPDIETCVQALKLLRLIGLDHVIGYMMWQEELLAPSMKDSFPLMLPQNVHFNPNEPIIDVRTREEWDQGHIAGALHIPLALFAKEELELSPDKPLLMICGSGYRSSIAASLAKRKGFIHLASIKGGMQAWKKALLPIIKSED